MTTQKFYISDCIAGCKKLVKSDSVDLVFADPPFNIKFGGKQSRSYSYGVSKDKSIYYEDDMLKKDYVDWCSTWMQEAMRILKENRILIIMSSWNHVSAIENEANRLGFVTLNHWIWRYEFGVFTPSKLTTSHYTFLVLLKGNEEKREWTFNPGKKGYQEDVERKIKLLLDEFDPDERKKNVEKIATVIEEIIFKERATYSVDDFFDDIHRLTKQYTGIKHPCKLNENVLIKIFLTFSNENDFIVDLFMGAGTSLVAASLTNRKFIGFEIDEKYREVIKELVGKRLALRKISKKMM